ncbi:MAG: hypothetical protein ACWA5U_05040 [bacterium]
MRQLVFLLSSLLLWQTWVWAMDVHGLSAMASAHQAHSPHSHHIDMLYEHGKIVPHTHHEPSHKPSPTKAKLADADTAMGVTVPTDQSLNSTDTDAEPHCCHVQGSTAFTLLADHVYFPQLTTSQPPMLSLTQYYAPFLTGLYRPPIT